MPGTPTTGSTNIAVLDSKIVADLCAGYFYVDITPSVWIGSGKDNVLGANVEIVNPYGVIVKPYGANYEIAPDLSGGMDGVISFAIPTQANNYQYGQYKVNVQLFDDGGASWIVSKYVKICAPDRSNKNVKYGSLSALLKADCVTGRLFVVVDSVPTYNGTLMESQVLTGTLEYPTSSGLAVLNFTTGNFAVVLFEGVYKLVGEICATYNYGDNVYAKVKYKIKKEKNVRCLIDECCVLSALVELQSRTETDCTDAEKENTASTIVEALSLLKITQLSAECGEDPSDYVEKLEKLLDCKCTCNCAEGAPIIGTTPSNNVVIEGCNIDTSVDGLTTTYTINNYAYKVEINENGGALVASAGTLDGCTVTQQITFNIATVYTQIKALANQNNTEADAWAAIVNKALRDIDPDCLGISNAAWQALTFAEKFALWLAKTCSCCGCSGAVSETSVSNTGADVTLEWEESSDVFSVDVYLDNVFQGNVLAGVKEFTFVGAADGGEHTFRLIPRCSNGSPGTPYQDVFLYMACPEIAPPVMTSSLIEGAACPFDLTTNVGVAPPAGITYEYHNAENTDPSSLVPDPENVSTGNYWVYAKNADGCYSKVGTKVTVICESAISCTAPQNLTIVKIGPNEVVRFQSAAYPPPGNSYTVKRRLASDPDVDGSYTTIGTPTWSVPLNRWIIADNTASDNILYVYKAISNCGDSPQTFPSITAEWADITCPTPGLTPGTDNVDYQFTPQGGEIDKYEVELYDSTKTILIEKDTHTPSFSNPTTGNFDYLTPGTDYNVRIKVYIGTYVKTCAWFPFTTDAEV